MMLSGGWIIFLIVLLFILISVISFYCHFFGDSGGRSFALQSNDSKPRIIMYRKKCKCSDDFKGLCKYCENSDQFVGADGGIRILDDFADYGGEGGFDTGPQSPTGDPIRGFLGGQKNDQSHQGHGHEESNVMYGGQGGQGGQGGHGGTYDSTDMSGIYQ